MFNYYSNTARFVLFSKTLSVLLLTTKNSLSGRLLLMLKHYSFPEVVTFSSSPRYKKNTFFSKLSRSSPHDKKNSTALFLEFVPLPFLSHITFHNSCRVVLFSSQHFPQGVAFSSPPQKKQHFSFLEFVSPFPLTIKT